MDRGGGRKGVAERIARRIGEPHVRSVRHSREGGNPDHEMHVDLFLDSRLRGDDGRKRGNDALPLSDLQDDAALRERR